ncbi:MAG: lamin tail domain-containing protein [Verrucomicrobia bacterium]|nr:lamin tail domain-containing protein [Verrucomicrobiota bacterium]
MIFIRTRPASVALLFLSGFLLPGAAIFEENTPWKYFKGTQEASSPVTAWRMAGFNDAAWLTGNAPFFYERSSGFTGNTDLTDMYGGYTCIFMRKTFVIASPSGVLDLTLSLRTDDGCIVWINGTEVRRINMPAGDMFHDDVSLGAAGEPNTDTYSIPNPGALLVAGTNAIAIQAFNSSIGSSSDFLIAGALSTTVDTVPPLAEAAPPPGAIVRQLTMVEILFTEAVTGVNASDFLVNGVAATGMTAVSPVDYIFSFPQPANGAVQVAWASGHGITDVSPALNPFGGGSWSYTLDPTAPAATVIVSEFMADNEHLDIRDDDDSREDWIEILNLGPVSVNLAGWFLTDDDGDLTKWRFPSVNLAVGQYLVVWASEKDRRDPSKPLHTNFKLGAGGEYLALVGPDTNVVSAFAPEYPDQPEDKSYGRALGAPSVVGFFDTPTPGGPNATSGAGFAPEPVFSLAGGAYRSNSVTVRLSAPSGTIRYTTDGSIPSASSTAYGAPIVISSSMRIKARVFQAGLLPGPVVAHVYDLLASDAYAFNSNLPLIIINTHGQSMPGSGSSTRVNASAVVIDTFRGRAALTDAPQWEGVCQVQERGQSSAGWAKRQYNLELNNPYGIDEEVPLLGLPEESDWVLNGPYSDKTLMNNFLAFELHEQMGHYAVRRRYCELFVAQDSSGNLVNYPGDYRGVYVLLEKIKIDNNRVDIERLSPYDTAEPDITGGYMWKKDKDSPGDVNFSTPRQGLKFHDPDGNELTAAQRTWLTSHLTAFENTLYGTSWLDPVNGYAKYIDVDSFVDNHWIVEFAKQIDGYRLSNYMHKDRAGRIKMDPIWDWNLAWGNADYLDGGHFSNWYYTQIGETEHIWLRRLVSGPGAPDFQQAIVDRWSVLRTNIMARSRLLARVDEIYNYLLESAARDWSKYASQRASSHWPNPTGSPTWDVNYATPGTYSNLIHGPQGMKHWIAGRFDWVDAQFHRAPEFNHPGGDVVEGFAVAINAPAGTIYYTTDGRDPRAPGGSVAAWATRYTGPVVIQGNARLVARTYVGAGKWANIPWSGPAAALYVTATPPLVITEMMYHPAAAPAGDTNDAGNFEFIELKNNGTAALSLAGFQFVNGIQFNFSTGAVASLGPGERVLVVKDQAAFASRYGAVAGIAGTYAGNLRDAGEGVSLVGPVGEVVHDFEFADGWYPVTDGLGFSLVAADEGGARAEWDVKAGWRAGSVLHGTPGQPEPAPPQIPPILVNEALTHTDLPKVDAIELYNPHATNVDVGGWFLSDDFRSPKYPIPAGTVIPAGGYLVLDESDFNATPGTACSFNLRSSGDEVYLFSADAAGHLSGYVHGFEFGASLNGITFGRHVTSIGAEHFVAQSANTLSSANAGPRVGPIVISEIMYRPRDVFVNNAYWDNTEHEFVELCNIASTNVPLFDPHAPTNVWRLRDAVSYAFPSNQVMAAGERILVVDFDPVASPAMASAFRARFGVSPAVRLFGPYGGKLANDDDSVELVQPDLVRFYTNEIVITAVLIDKVHYRDASPWPLAADGIGFSLQRAPLDAYGDDPAHWVGAAPTPGAGYVGGTEPVILTQPGSQTVVAGNNASLLVEVGGTGPFQFQWLCNGRLVAGATNASLYLVGVGSAQAGDYQVLVMNAANSVASAIATLTVLVPARIVTQPQSVDAVEGSTVTLSVAATSSSPIRYQWRRNGIPVAGATNAVFAMPNVQVSDEGNYDVQLTDDVATITSAVAVVGVLAPPAMVQPVPPVHIEAVQGDDVVLALQCSGILPIDVRWRRINASGARTLYEYDSTNLARTITITLTNVTSTNAGTYVLALKNRVGGGWTAANLVTNAFLTVLDDTDGDRLPDAWEDTHGLNAGSGDDAGLDADGDGVSNGHEYIAGTDPQDPASYLKLETPTAGAGCGVNFMAVANRSYTVLYRNASAQGAWLKLADVVAQAATRLESVPDPDAGPQRYYRLVTPMLLP